MHDHHGSSADPSGLNLLPLWLQVLWVFVMGAVVAHHAIAAAFGRSPNRVWSAAHALLATGMLYMFLPWPDAPLRAEVLVSAYCGLLIVSLTISAAHWIASGSVQFMGLLIALDCAAMAYMSQMTGSGANRKGSS